MKSPFARGTRLTAVLLAALALSGCGQTPDTASVEPSPSATATTPGTMMPYPPSPDAADTLSAVPAKYRADQGFRACATPAINSCASNAVTRDALGALDPSVCDAIPYEGMRPSCRTQVAAEAAVRGKDLDTCALAGTGSSQGCLAEAARRLATETADPSWCGKLPEAQSGSGTGPMTGAAPADACRFAAGASVKADAAKKFCAEIKDAGMATECGKMAERRAEMEAAYAASMPTPPAISSEAAPTRAPSTLRPPRPAR